MKRYLIALASFVALFLIAGCGGGISNAEKNPPPTTTVKYKMNYPSDTEVLPENSTFFHIERDTDGVAATQICTASSQTHDARLKVVKVDATTQTSTPVLNEIVHIPNDCKFKVYFLPLHLIENETYAWHISDANIVEDPNVESQWNSFMYSNSSMGLEDSDPFSCENNLIQNPSFVGGVTPWHYIKSTNFTTISTPVAVQMGDEDNSSTLITGRDVLYEELANPVEQGKYID